MLIYTICKVKLHEWFHQLLQYPLYLQSQGRYAKVFHHKVTLQRK